jgi:hypothetical protein
MAGFTDAQRDGFCYFDTSMRAFQLEKNLASDGNNRWEVLASVQMYANSLMWDAQRTKDHLSAQQYQQIVAEISAGTLKDSTQDAHYCRGAMMVTFAGYDTYGQTLFRKLAFEQFIEHAPLAGVSSDKALYQGVGLFDPATFDNYEDESHR